MMHKLYYRWKKNLLLHRCRSSTCHCRRFRLRQWFIGIWLVKNIWFLRQTGSRFWETRSRRGGGGAWRMCCCRSLSSGSLSCSSCSPTTTRSCCWWWICPRWNIVPGFAGKRFIDTTFTEMSRNRSPGGRWRRCSTLHGVGTHRGRNFNRDTGMIVRTARENIG